jgi:hypothetical protein
MRPSLLLPLFLALAGPAGAQSATEIIGAQIDAFRQQDFTTAFDFASAELRALFRTPENFGRMVAEGYPMVLDPAEVQYLRHGERQGYEVQHVLIRDRQGGVFLLEYLFLGEGPARRIAGVRILPESGVGV